MTHASVQQELLAQLRINAGDRPAHLELLDELIVWYTTGHGEEPSLERPGISFALAVDLAGDVERAFAGQGTLAYPAARAKHRSAAAKRRRTLDTEPTLASLLPRS